ncbi:phage major capsid protein [Rhizobium sullae]|nr:phage major capsid protein [Rhizobium sullae]
MGGESISEIADRLKMPAPAQRILKAAVSAGTLSDPEWAAQLADLNAASSAFLQSLGGRSAFASLLDMGVITRAPLRSHVGVVSEGVVGAVNREGEARPVSRMTLNGGTLLPRRADAVIALSREIIENSSAASQAFVSRQLRRAVAKALDTGFVDSLVTSATPSFSSTGEHSSDLKILLDAVNSGWGRLAWISSVDVANSICLLDDGRGRAGPEGVSEFLNLPFCVSPALADGTLLLLDGDLIAADITSLGVDIARHASLQMNDAPTNDAGAPTATNLTSTWQTNTVGIRLSTLFGGTSGAPDAMAIMTGITWGTLASG